MNKNIIALMALALTAVSDVVAETPKYQHLVFQDEFDYNGLPDSTKWSFERGYKRNHEMQYYTAGRLENARVENGCLHLVALNDSAVIDGEMRPVTSASIHTKNTFPFKYGRIEVRARLASCLGTWPAIWLMPVDRVYGNWPKSGEIDIMENVGYDPEKINYAIHTASNNHTKKNGFGSNAFCADNAGEFHVYGLEWDENSLTWLLDGRKRFRLVKPADATWEQWPFDERFYLILNLAFGGGWGGTKGVAPEELPQDYEIDYVRIYQ